MSCNPTALGQILLSAARLDFGRLATKLDGPRRSDALSRWWSQLLALVVGHVGQRQSLRAIEPGRARAWSTRL